MKLKVLELFGGIGACSKALERLGIDYEIADYVEIDKYAVASYNAMHDTNFEPQDVCTWDKDIKVDLLMHGSPCQDFSLAGKQAGGDEGSGTRSSLMYETIRIVEKLKPKYVIWENVKNLLSKKHRHNFEAYLNQMSEIGYANYYQVLNSKDYGIPQNRERVFTVSILGNKEYSFPNGKNCVNSIKVVGNYMPSNHDASRIVDENGLAPTVKENHGTVTGVIQRKNELDKFLDKTIKNQNNDFEIDKSVKPSVAINIEREKDKIINSNLDIYNCKCKSGWQDNKVGINLCPTIRANNNNTYILEKDFSFPKEKELNIKLKDLLDDEVDEKYYLSEKMINFFYKNEQVQKEKGNGFRFGVSDGNVIAKAVTTRAGSRMDDNFIIGSTQKHAKVSTDGVVPTLTSAMGMGGGHVPMIANKTICLNSKGGRKGIDGLQPSRKDRIYDSNGIAATIATSDFYNPNYTDNLKIRKLTPKECWRLMGFDDGDFEKAEKVNSNTQLYKQAGNSIVVNVLEAILKNLLF